jgi:hypothetical protein
MTQGSVEKTILGQAYTQDAEIPEIMREAPDLSPGLELYRTMFFDLSSCRSLGMGVGPIPWTAIHAYCRHHELDVEQEDMAHYLLRRMDEFFLEHVNRKKN